MAKKATVKSKDKKSELIDMESALVVPALFELKEIKMKDVPALVLKKKVAKRSRRK